MALQRLERPRLVAALVGCVLVLDLVWSLAAGSTGTLAYAAIDEPAHLATCAVGLLLLRALRDRPLPALFCAVALLASVAIDLDHVPGLLGSHALTGSLPRPYSHSLLLVAALGLAALLTRRAPVREICAGAAFGIAVHLLRDVATGPGVPLLWPLSDDTARMPYAVLAVLLAAAALMYLLRSRRPAAGALVRTTAATVAVVALVPLALAGSAHAAKPPRVALGAYIPHAGEDPSVIDAYGAEVGERPVLVSSYKDWTKPLIDPAELDEVWSRGAVPIVTWEPWNQHDESETFPLSSIAAGCCDAFIAESARAAAAWGHPLMLRFAHEMNGGWYPWGKGRPGSSPAAYRAAWRHVVSIFRENGATNVKWVWTPYVMVGHRFPFSRYYPGDRWVDWAGLDGLNGGSVFGWRSFAEVFGESYERLVAVTEHPLILAEVGSTEEGGSKAAWLSTGLRSAVSKMPHIRAIVWWADSGDYRGNFGVDSSPAALRALRSAARKPEYRSSRAQLLATPGWLGQAAATHRAHHRRRGAGV